jgi:carboxylesterase
MASTERLARVTMAAPVYPFGLLPAVENLGEPVTILPGAEPFAHDGSKVGVLMCHGFTSCPQSLRPWAEALADAGYTVRLPLLPGHGTTWQELNRTRWPDWYAAVSTVLDELVQRCRAVVVTGLSMGGALALRLAARRGQDIAGLIVINPAVKAEDPRLALLPVLQYLVPSLPGIGSDISKHGSSELAYSRIPLRALGSLTRLWADVVPALPLVSHPLLLLRSAQDHVIPASSSALVLRQVSSSDVQEVLCEDSYHVATLDNDAELIVKQSREFIERVTGAAGGA